jgi:hypothetical protein
MGVVPLSGATASAAEASAGDVWGEDPLLAQPTHDASARRTPMGGVAAPGREIIPDPSTRMDAEQAVAPGETVHWVQQIVTVPCGFTAPVGVPPTGLQLPPVGVVENVTP